jgi:Lon protease-like protein
MFIGTQAGELKMAMLGTRDKPTYYNIVGEQSRAQWLADRHRVRDAILMQRAADLLTEAAASIEKHSELTEDLRTSGAISQSQAVDAVSCLHTRNSFDHAMKLES